MKLTKNYLKSLILECKKENKLMEQTGNSFKDYKKEKIKTAKEIRSEIEKLRPKFESLGLHRDYAEIIAIFTRIIMS